MTNKLIIIIFIILSIYYYYDKKYIDTFADTLSNIDKAINDVYSINIDKIRDLYNTIDKIQNNGLILKDNNSLNNANIKGKLTVKCETNINGKLNIDSKTTINNPININNNVNIKGSVLSLEGTAKSGNGSHCYLELYPKPITEGKKTYIGYSSNDSNNLEIITDDINSIIIGNNTKENAININPDGDTTINGNLFINGNIPIINVAYKNTLDDNQDKNFNNSNIDNVICTTNYTPKLDNSLIHITCDCDYFIGGWGDEDFFSYIYINNIKVQELFQWFKASGQKKNGGGTRSVTIFPISCVYNNINNPTNTPIKIQIKVSRKWGNDFIKINNNRFLLVVTEYNATELT